MAAIVVGDISKNDIIEMSGVMKAMGLASAIGTINKHIDKFMKLGKSEV